MKRHVLKPWELTQEEINALPSRKQEVYRQVIVALNGGRDANAVEMLKELGYLVVRVFEGDIVGYRLTKPVIALTKNRILHTKDGSRISNAIIKRIDQEEFKGIALPVYTIITDDCKLIKMYREQIVEHFNLGGIADESHKYFGDVIYPQ